VIGKIKEQTNTLLKEERLIGGKVDLALVTKPL
jgi:hypothetical protein